MLLLESDFSTMSSSRLSESSAALNTEEQPRYAVELKGLDKTYAASGRSTPKHALKSVDLQIPRGSLFGLLGPNGAGKSTMINILAGLVNKSAGDAKIWGYDVGKHPRAAARSIGVVPQELNVDAFFTPEEMLDVQAGLYGVPADKRRTQELLEIVGLSDKAQAYARALSGGMKRRLMVAKAMVHNPPVLVLDEPTAGVDVELRQQLWQQVKKLNDQGTTVLLTTHYLEEAEELCDEIAIINHGRVIARDQTANLVQRLDQKELHLTLSGPLSTLPAPLKAFGFRIMPGQEELGHDTKLGLQFRRGQIDIAQAIAAVQKEGLQILDLSTIEPDLEDIFLALTQADNHETASENQSAA